MKIKNLTISTLFLTLGLVLHITVPGTVGLMKPDFMLAFFFFALLWFFNGNDNFNARW
ncbi:hypothetical protein PT170_01695 [Erysipelothrix rhusiopathiae]|nr:hypothetical protein [Erysipelothrix rhusiopathiae]